MDVFTAAYIPVGEDHPCDYLLGGDEERMITVEDYIETMTSDIVLSTDAKYRDMLQKEVDEVKTAVAEQGLTDIVIAMES